MTGRTLTARPRQTPAVEDAEAALPDARDTVAHVCSTIHLF